MKEGMDGLSQLLGRVEGASGPDRELDKALWYKLIFDPALDADPEGYSWMRVMGQGYPAWTASLDASLTLVERTMPSGRLLEVRGTWEPDQPLARPAWTVKWYPPSVQPDGTNWHAQIGSAATPALALLAAMLRALSSPLPASSGEDHG